MSLICPLWHHKSLILNTEQSGTSLKFGRKHYWEFEMLTEIESLIGQWGWVFFDASCNYPDDSWISRCGFGDCRKIKLRHRRRKLVRRKQPDNVLFLFHIIVLFHLFFCDSFKDWQNNYTEIFEQQQQYTKEKRWKLCFLSPPCNFTINEMTWILTFRTFSNNFIQWLIGNEMQCVHLWGALQGY